MPKVNNRRGIPNHFTRWNPLIAEKIYAFVRAGAFPHIAAQAAGLPLNVFHLWMKRGDLRYSIFRQFKLHLLECQAQARVGAEISTYQDNPEVWLRQGPGKDAIDNPGWSHAAKAIIHNSSQTLNLVLTPELAAIFGSVFQILSPYPDALKAVQIGLANVPLGKQSVANRSRKMLEVKNEAINASHENRRETRENLQNLKPIDAALSKADNSDP